MFLNSRVLRNQPQPLLDRAALKSGSLPLALRIYFEFDGPVTSIKVQGYATDSNNPPHIPNPYVSIHESLDGSHWQGMPGVNSVPMADLSTASTLGLGKFRAFISDTSLAGGSLYSLWILGEQ